MKLKRSIASLKCLELITLLTEGEFYHSCFFLTHPGRWKPRVEEATT